MQAAIAALHCQAARAEETDWTQIVKLYDLLERFQPSPIVSLNSTVAISMVDGPQVALVLIDELAAELDGYHLFHAARAELLRRVGALGEDAQSYARTLALVTGESERRFLERPSARISVLTSSIIERATLRRKKKGKSLCS